MAYADGMDSATREASWRERIAACETSGMTAVRYCRETGIPVSKYYRWKWELSRRDAPTSLPALFAEVLPVARDNEGPPPPIEIALPGERVVRVPVGFDAETLAQVVRVLEGLGC